MKSANRTIHILAKQIQNLINELHDKEPENKTFEQEGMLNGSIIVQEYLDEGEYELAIEHLLYMVYESEISYPKEVMEELGNFSDKYKIKNPYS